MDAHEYLRPVNMCWPTGGGMWICGGTSSTNGILLFYFYLLIFIALSKHLAVAGLHLVISWHLSLAACLWPPAAGRTGRWPPLVFPGQGRTHRRTGLKGSWGRLPAAPCRPGGGGGSPAPGSSPVDKSCPGTCPKNCSLCPWLFLFWGPLGEMTVL